MIKFVTAAILALAVLKPGVATATDESSFAKYFLSACVANIGLIEDYQSFAKTSGWKTISAEGRKSFGGKIGDNEKGHWLIEAEDGTEFLVIFQEGKTDEGKSSYGCSLLTKKGDFTETVVELKKTGQVHKIRDVNTPMMFVQMFLAAHPDSGKSMIIAMKNKTKPSGEDNGGFAVTITK